MLLRFRLCSTCCCCNLGGRALDKPILLRHWTHQEIGNKTYHHKASHDVQDHRVSLLLRQVVGDVMVEDAVDDERPHDACGGPGGQQAPMDGAHMIAAEKILEISRDGGESSAVHADQHARNQHKKRDRIQVRNFRKRK